jgi:hypothetical protein
MELSEHVIIGCVSKAGNINTSAIGGDKIKINIAETEILKTTCPHNKKWAVNITVDIVETDV